MSSRTLPLGDAFRKFTYFLPITRPTRSGPDYALLLLLERILIRQSACVASRSLRGLMFLPRQTPFVDLLLCAMPLLLLIWHDAVLLLKDAIVLLGRSRHLVFLLLRRTSCFWVLNFKFPLMPVKF